MPTNTGSSELDGRASCQPVIGLARNGRWGPARGERVAKYNRLFEIEAVESLPFGLASRQGWRSTSGSAPGRPVTRLRFGAPDDQDLAAGVFVTSGVDAPVRENAAMSGVGMGTIYRHFPTRADLVIAVYRHQVEACAEAGPALLESSGTPLAGLRHWIDLFVDFLVTKHGLAAALRSDDASFESLHAYFLDRLVPVCAELLAAAAAAGEISPDAHRWVGPGASDQPMIQPALECQKCR